MKQITGEEFIENICKDPSWCLSIKEPLEITSFVDLITERITHLSPLLHFKFGADFTDCKNLKEVTGTFYGLVYFDRSGVEKTTNLKILGVDKDGWSAAFHSCKSLKILEGKFEGAISIKKSSVEDIKATVNKGLLDITTNLRSETSGVKFFLSDCINLTPHEKYLKKEYQIDNDFKQKCEKIKLRKDLSRFQSPQI